MTVKTNLVTNFLKYQIHNSKALIKRWLLHSKYSFFVPFLDFSMWFYDLDLGNDFGNLMGFWFIVVKNGIISKANQIW